MTRHLAMLAALLTLFLTIPFARGEVALDALVADANLSLGETPARDREGWRAPRKIVVSDAYGLIARLEAAFPGVEIVGVSSSAETTAAVADADAVIGSCSEDVVATASRLQWIQIFSAGAEGCLAVPGVADGSILLTNMQKMASPTIGEHAIALMLAVTRGLAPFAKLMPDGDWDRSLAGKFEVTPVAGKTMLVVGLGGIGTAIAKRASALGMRVLATRNSSREGPDYVEYVGLSDELLELAGKADVIANALPLTPATTGLFDEAFFDAVKPGAYFVNVARGGSVVTEALMAALDDGRIRGAGLDVTEPEPLPANHPLWQYPNVIITPHMAGSGNDRAHYGVLIEENLRRFIEGDALYNVVDPGRGY